MNPLYERPTEEEVIEALGIIATKVPFFPQGSAALALIADDILDFVGTREQLEWFVRQAGAWLSKYEGIPQLRALFCTKYAPFDGKPPIVDCPGFEEDALEAAYRRKEMVANDRRLAEYRRQAALAPPEDREPLLLPDVKTLPDVPVGQAPKTAAEDLAGVKAAIACPWCAAGHARVRSSVSGAIVHIATEVGRVVCKNKSDFPPVLHFEPAPEVQA
jgi:hypothetical protein